MQNKEIEEALKSMRIFARVHQDMTTVSAREMEIVLQYIEQLERTIKTTSKEQTHKQDDYCKHYCNIMIEHKYLLEDKQKLIEKLEKDNIRDTESVKRYEEMRRNCTNEFYLKSYQTTIHKLNAKREVRSAILSMIKGED